jgi:hypothetical protein
MPTAVEYALTTPWHTQNGCGSGPPALNVVHGGLPSTASGQTQAAAAPAVPAGEALLTSPLAVLLLTATLLAAIRRRLTRTCASSRFS